MACLDRDQRQVEDGVPLRCRQAPHGPVEINHESQAGLRHMGQTNDTQSPHFQHPGQSPGSAGKSVHNVYLIVGNKGKATIDQAQQEIGLARSGGPDQQHARTSLRSAASVYLHRFAI